MAKEPTDKHNDDLFPLTPVERTLIEQYQQLDERGRFTLLSVAEVLVRRQRVISFDDYAGLNHVNGR